MDQPSTPPPKPTFREALAFWAKLGFISFGGPAGQVAIMHAHVVERKRWVSESRFMHALNYCMLLPGPEAQQLATYIGWLLHGRRGGLAAGALFVLPSMFILLALTMAYVNYGTLPWVAALFYGLKPAVIAIIAAALFKIGKRSLISPLHWIIAAAAFGCILLDVPFPLIILGAMVLATLAQRWMPSLLKGKAEQAGSGGADESSYYLHAGSAVHGIGFNPARLLRGSLGALLIWAVPFTLLFLLGGDPVFWRKLSLFFTQAAFVTFGGAYAVLPYVAQVSVEKLGWLSDLQMIDGLALGETTPGPLIMVLAFVGFMAGYNHFDASMAMGTVGLVATTFFTFLPSFVFIFTGAPIIERTRGNLRLKAALSIVTASVVGVMLNLTIYLGRAVLFPNGAALDHVDLFALAWVLLSFLALHRFKLNMLLWLGISAVYGTALHMLIP